MKNVLVLVGSNNDIDEKGKPTRFVETLETTIKTINLRNASRQIDYHLDSCSADRTPFLLRSAINREKFDGIIYHGGYALVLGAALQEALSGLRSEYNIEDTSAEMRRFIGKNPELMYVPKLRYCDEQTVDRSEQFDIRNEESKYHHDTSFIPTIGVPGKDTPSQGLSALLSIAENPAGCEPRPVVGTGRIDVALEAMHNILYGMQNKFESVTIAYEQPNQQLSSEDPETKKGAEEIRKKLNEFGFQRCAVVPAKDLTEKEYKQHRNELVIAVCDDYTTSKNAAEKTIISLDISTRLMINCPAKKKMNGLWEQYLETITTLDNTISVGVGNYDNAAILAAQLLSKPKVLEGMWQYRNGKTLQGVIEKPTWLVDRKARRE